jgi:hypothetical protein
MLVSLILLTLGVWLIIRVLSRVRDWWVGTLLRGGRDPPITHSAIYVVNLFELRIIRGNGQEPGSRHYSVVEEAANQAASSF